MNPDLVRLADNALWFVGAAALMALGMWVLYLALGLYGLALERLINYLGVTAALREFCLDKRNQRTWWNRMIDWSIEKWRRVP